MKLSKEFTRSVNVAIFTFFVLFGLVVGILTGMLIIGSSDQIRSTDIIFCYVGIPAASIMAFGFIGIILGQNAEDNLWWKYGDHGKNKKTKVIVGKKYRNNNPYTGEGNILILDIVDGVAKCKHVDHKKYTHLNDGIEYKPVDVIEDYYSIY